MLPNFTRHKTLEHRRNKRSREVSLMIERISGFLAHRGVGSDANILEFGSGNGFQIPYLQKIGSLTASDLFVSDEIQQMQSREFVQCSIADAPFRDAQFDLIFSNHVIEHIVDLKEAFAELKRVGKPSCVYAFSVPTNIWLMLSIPASYWMKARRVVAPSVKPAHHVADPASLDSTLMTPALNEAMTANIPKYRRSKLARILRALSPRSHGVERDFIQCYKNFRIKNWQRLFLDNGFKVVESVPLLLYGPSEWPVIPTMRNKGNICSSVLFLMHKS